MININTDLTEIKNKYAELKAYLVSLETEVKDEDLKLLADLHSLFKGTSTVAPVIVAPIVQPTPVPVVETVTAPVVAAVPTTPSA